MNRHKFLKLFLIPFLCIFASCERQEGSNGKEGEAQSNGRETEVRQQAESYIDAINKRDIDALLDHWSEEAVYRNPLTGTLVQGREGIKKEFEIMFSQLDNTQVEMRIDSIRFPFEDKAVEEGYTWLLRDGETPVESDYKMTYVKKDGKWLILNVSKLDLGVLGQK